MQHHPVRVTTKDPAMRGIPKNNVKLNEFISRINLNEFISRNNF
jgi:hypothetical protein